IEPHEVRTQNPDAQRLMMTSEDSVGQIVKAPLTGLTPIALPLGLCVIMPLFGDLRTLAMGARDAIGSARSINQGRRNRTTEWEIAQLPGIQIEPMLYSFPVEWTLDGFRSEPNL